MDTLSPHSLSPQFLRRIEQHPSRRLLRIVADDIAAMDPSIKPSLAGLPRIAAELRRASGCRRVLRAITG